MNESFVKVVGDRLCATLCCTHFFVLQPEPTQTVAVIRDGTGVRPASTCHETGCTYVTSRPQHPPHRFLAMRCQEKFQRLDMTGDLGTRHGFGNNAKTNLTLAPLSKGDLR